MISAKNNKNAEAKEKMTSKTNSPPENQDARGTGHVQAKEVKTSRTNNPQEHPKALKKTSFTLPIICFFLGIILIFHMFYSNYPTEEAQESYFCNICECKLVQPYFYDINCSTDVLQYIFDSSYWSYWNNNQTYIHRSLAVQNNSIYRLDRQFPQSRITSLSLQSCSIKYISDKIFSNLQFLETLVLSYNFIENLDPKAFMGQYTENKHLSLPLKNVLLDHNKIENLYEEIFQATPNIKVLSLAHNPLILSTQTVKAINSLTVLERLDISYTALESLPRTFLYSHTELRYLDLSGNRFLEVPIVLGNIVNLEVLYFNNNPIKYLGSGNSCFPQVRSVKTLYMCNMPRLIEIGSGSFSKLMSLEILHVCNNSQLRNIHKDALLLTDEGKRSWPPIKKLYLNNNKLTSLDKDLLLEWRKLEKFDLTNNPWSCGCENPWMIDELFCNVLLLIDHQKAQSLTCESPSSLRTLRFVDMCKEGRMAAECRIFNDLKKDDIHTHYIVIDIFVIAVLVLIILLMLGATLNVAPLVNNF